MNVEISKSSFFVIYTIHLSYYIMISSLHFVLFFFQTYFLFMFFHWYSRPLVVEPHPCRVDSLHYLRTRKSKFDICNFFFSEESISLRFHNDAMILYSFRMWAIMTLLKFLSFVTISNVFPINISLISLLCHPFTQERLLGYLKVTSATLTFSMSCESQRFQHSLSLIMFLRHFSCLWF